MTEDRDKSGLSNERHIYLNGNIIPESQAAISVHDRGFKLGDAVFDTTRTFGHRIFKMKEHIDRLYRSMKYLRLDPGMTPQRMAEVTEEVLARNLHLIDEEEDYWVSQRVTRGEEFVVDGLFRQGNPTVIVECMPLPLKARAKLFRDGVRVIVPHVRRISPEALSPRAKTHNYLNLFNAEMEAKALDPEAWAVLLDENGNLSEGNGCNFFMVECGRLVTPKAKYVLPGISRATVMELASKKGIPVEERDIDLFDAYNAEEMFVTATSICLCPVSRINGRSVGELQVPGPITKTITDAYIKLVGHDFVQQYLRQLDR